MMLGPVCLAIPLLWLFLTGIHRSSAQCPGSQKPLAGRCLQLLLEEKSYHEAKSWCQKQTGELVQIRDSKMKNDLLTMINDGERYWVDVPQGPREQLHKWDAHKDGSHEKPYRSLCSMIFRGSQNQWKNAPTCQDKMGFICSFAGPKLHRVKDRSLCLWGFCISSRRTTTKKPAVTKKRPNSTARPPNLNSFTPIQMDNLANMTMEAAIQITSELVSQLVNMVSDIWDVSLLSKASDVLTHLVNFSDFLSPETQVNASDLLLGLSEQLSGSLAEDVNATREVVVDAAQSLFHAFDATIKASLENQENLTSDQIIHILDTSVASIGYIEGALFSESKKSTQNYAFSSTISSISMSRVMSTDLTTAQFSSDPPAAIRVTFPNCSTLRSKTESYEMLNVLVLALSVNPFNRLSPVEIVGPVVNILLGSDDGAIDVQNMTEYIEIVLMKNQNSSDTESKMTLTKYKNLMLSVNVTSANHTVVVITQPKIPVPLNLKFGFQADQNSSFIQQNISFPNDGLYTWVLTPDMFINGTGVYYINVTVANASIWGQMTSLDFTINIFASQCVFWDEELRIWNNYGCHVGARSTPLETHCLCNHLTFFASTFLVMPHVVDISDSLTLFANVANNPVGLALLGALIGFFVIVVCWAGKKDREDLKKVRIAILTDNDPAFHCRYMVKVCTGFRKGSGTTSQVVLTLYGSEGQSDPHLLTDSGKEIFHRGAVDVFLLKTRHLGELHSLRLWHSNSGSSPSWFVHRVTVTDLDAQKTWFFLCDSWLASDMTDCQLDRVFPSASKANLMSLRYLLFSGSVEKLLKDHLWFSVWTRCPWSPFSRAQRICCCMCLLFCSLVINIMFWNDHSDEDSKTGKFFITFTQVKISIQTSGLLLPVNFLIVQMFQLIQVQLKQVDLNVCKLRASLASKPPAKNDAAQQLLKDIKDIVDFLQKYIIQVLGESADDLPTSECDSIVDHLGTISHLVRDYISPQSTTLENTKCVTVITAQHCHFLHYLYKVLEKLQYQVASVDLSHVSRPIEYIEATNMLFDLKELLKSHNVSGTPLPSSLTTSFPVSLTQKTCCQLPKCFTFLCWLFLFGISAFSGYYMVLISLDMTKDRAISWLISILLSIVQSVFFIPPVKVFAQTIFMFRVLKRVNIEDAAEERQLYGLLGLLASRPDWELSGCRDPTNPVYQPPANKNTISLKKQRLLEQKLYKLIQEIVVHLIFLVTTMIQAYAEKSPDEYNLYRAIDQSFSVTYNSIERIPDFYGWSRDTLLPNLYSDYPGFITDGNCFLLGSPRIRQLRIPNSSGKPGLYNMEDFHSYGIGWDTNRSSDAPPDMWAYHSEEELGGYPIWAKFGYYSGGGYVSELGLNRTSADSIIDLMESSAWLDGLTKVIFVEFNVYNANINLFCLVTFILERTLIGNAPDTGVVYREGIPVTLAGGLSPSTDLLVMRLYQNTDGIFTVGFVSYLIFLLIVVYSIIVQAIRLKEQKCSYFRQTSNLLDLSIIVICLSNTGLYLKRVFLRRRDVDRYHLDRTRFVSFYETAMIDTAHGYSVAFLVALMTAKLWRLLNLNPNLHLITVTLQRSWNEISGFLLTILILLVAYAISCNLLFGWTVSNYRTFFDSLVTIISLIMGIFNYEEVINLDPVLGSLLIFTCVIFLMFVIVNIFLSALLHVFSSERKNPTPYEDKEIVDMLLERVSGVLGIRKKMEPLATVEKDKML